jgi:hypothetical protein
MKNIPLLPLLLLLTLTGFSQKLFVRAGIGGAIGVASTSSYILLHDVTSYASAGTYNRFPVAFGNGFNFTAAFGSSVTKYFGAELGVNYFMGLPMKGENTMTLSGSTITEKISVYGWMLQLVPAIILSPGLEKLNPYMKLGAIFGIVPVFYQENKNDQNSSVIYSANYVKKKYHGGVAIGFTASAGCEYNLSKKFACYAEVNFNGIDYNPTKSSLVAYEVNGINNLESLSTRDRETEFVDSRVISSSSQSGNEPLKAIKQSYPFSNVALNIGLKLRFGKSL